MGMKAKWGRADWEARLNGGVVMYNNVPCRIRYNGEILSLLDLTTDRTLVRNVDPLDESLDVSSLRLGFINTPNGAIYLQRSPLRRYKQAVDDRAVSESFLTPTGFRHGGEGRSDYLYTEYFRNTYTKPWPTYQHALDLLRRDVPSVALSSFIAITVDDLGLFKVWYKFEQVGYIDPSNPSVVCVPTSEKAWVISMYLSELTWTVN